jgi:hypothetical protein
MIDKAQALVLLAEDRARLWNRWQDADNEVMELRDEQKHLEVKMKDIDYQKDVLLKEVFEQAKISTPKK